MNKKTLLSYIILLSLVLTACNDDVFIEHLEITPEESELGSDRMSDFLKVAGPDWHVFQVNYDDGEQLTFGEHSSAWHDNKLQIITSRSSLSLSIENDGIMVNLDRYLNDRPASLSIEVSGEYQQKSALINVLPTGSYTIEIKDVSYNLDTYSGYPDEDYSFDIQTVSFSQGLSEPTDYTFAPIKELPIIYWFRLLGNETEFTKRLLESRIKIPVPEYTWYTSFETPHCWMLLGQKVPLSSQQSAFFSTVMIPRMPAPVSLPAGKPLEVTLFCQQECVGLDLTVSAVNPVTGQTEEVPMKLFMFKPAKFTTEVKFK